MNAPQHDSANSPSAQPTGPVPAPMRPRRQALAWGVGLAAAAGGLFWSWRRGDAPGSPAAGGSPAQGSASSPEQLGESFWALTLAKPDETPLALADFRGKPLLLNFWATWCPPCVREMPMLDAAHRRWQASVGTRFLGIAVDRPSSVRSFLSASPVGFPVALMGLEGSNLSRELGNVQGGLPYTVLADASGRILQRQAGELTQRQLDAWEQALTQELARKRSQ